MVVVGVAQRHGGGVATGVGGGGGGVAPSPTPTVNLSQVTVDGSDEDRESDPVSSGAETPSANREAPSIAGCCC